MSATALRRSNGLRWSARLLNLSLAAALSALGALAWLVVQVTGTPAGRRGGHLRVIIDVNDGEVGPMHLNLRVPLNLLRVGVRLARVMPARARVKVDDALRSRRIEFDIATVRAEDLDAVIDALADMSVDITQEREDVSLRIFGE